MRFLLVENDKNMCREFIQRFHEEGYTIDICHTPDSSYEYLELNEYDCIITNTVFNKLLYVKHILKLRTLSKETPIIAYSVKVSTECKVRCLDNGANDYLILPFEFDELFARIRCHTRVRGTATCSILSAGDLSMDLRLKTVKRGDSEINLTLKEFAVLEYLLINKGMILSKEKIFRHVWDYDTGSDAETVKVYIRYLRKKLDDGHDNKVIKTIKNFGYTIEV